MTKNTLMDTIVIVEPEERYEKRLRDLFEAARWKLRRSRDDSADFIAENRAERYAVQIKYAKEARRSLLEGLVASSILRARVAGLAAGAKPLAIIAAPAISNALVKELGEFVARFGDGAAWGAMDDSGLVVLHGLGLENLNRERSRVRKPAAVQRPDIFSDLGQWMLKVLLSHRLPPELRFFAPVDDARIDDPVANAMSLARVSGVSVPTASRLVVALRDEGFLDEDSSVLELVRIDVLLDRWRAIYKRPPSEVHARWLFAPKDASRHLEHLVRKRVQKPGERLCLGLFAACEHLGFRFVRGVAPHLHVERVSAEVLRGLGLRLAEPGEAADVIAREPRFAEAVFRGAVDRDGVRVADVLQCWLDVADNPARGEEMAAHLFENVLHPSLLERER